MLHFNVESALLAATTEGATTLLDFEVTGVFQTFSKDCDARNIKISLLAAQELLSTRGANTLVVSMRETGHTGRVAKSLTREFAQDRLELKNWEQLNDFYKKAVDLGYTAEVRRGSSPILGAFLVGVFASVLASLFPAFRVSRIPIGEALRRIV